MKKFIGLWKIEFMRVFEVVFQNVFISVGVEIEFGSDFIFGLWIIF